MIALEIETGNTISANPIRPKKPSRALFMHILGNILMFLGLFLVYFWKVLLHMAGHKMSSNFFISFSFLKFLQRGKMLPEDQLLQIKLKWLRGILKVHLQSNKKLYFAPRKLCMSTPYPTFYRWLSVHNSSTCLYATIPAILLLLFAYTYLRVLRECTTRRSFILLLLVVMHQFSKVLVLPLFFCSQVGRLRSGNLSHSMSHLQSVATL